MLSMVTPQPILQHQPTRQSGTETSWAREMIMLTRRQHSRSNVSAFSPHLGQPREVEVEQQERTIRPDRRVPEPGHRQLSTRQTAADLWTVRIFWISSSQWNEKWRTTCWLVQNIPVIHLWSSTGMAPRTMFSVTWERAETWETWHDQHLPGRDLVETVLY